MSTTQYFRTACEECHTRKVRCKPSTEEIRGGTRCEACRINGRKCLFSLRSRTGRPRASALPAYNSIYKQSPPSASPTAVVFSSSYSTSGSNTTSNFPEPKPHEYSTLHHWPSSIDDQRGQSSLDFGPVPNQIRDQSHEGPDVAPGKYTGYSDGAWRSPSFTPPTQSAVSSASTYDPTANPYEDVLSLMYPAKAQQSSLTFDNQNTLENVSRASISQTPAPPPFTGNFSNGASQLPAFKTPFPVDSRKPETVSDIVQTIELCNEVRKYGYAIPSKNISILSSGDAAEVHELLNSIDKLCSKINSIIPQQPHSAQLQDQPTFILVFTAVMQAIDQTIIGLGSVAEFEHASQAEAASMDFLGMNIDLVGTDFRSDGGGAADKATSWSQSEQYHPISMGSEAPEMNFPQLQIEHLLSLTRLDFYLLRMKSFIAHFDASLELLAATKLIFHPVESSARLLSYHRCLETILGCWKNEWQK